MAVSKTRHILIENVSPSVDGGRYPAKHIAGEPCVVEADIFRDGHETIQAVLQWKCERDASYSQTPMRHVENDRWRAEFLVRDPGRMQFTICAWTVSENSAEDATVLEPPLEIVVDRLRARVGAWYEMFVRSQGRATGQAGTFRDAEARLPEIKSMGFDVIYLAPIHPIGRTARKGRNNSLQCGPNDPGCPWAIGNEVGGHTAIDPAIGSLADFERFMKTAAGLGLEIAMDFAPHCSPDHPWVKQHPDWFYRRSDGSIKCHENPPFRYEDVYPLNFDSTDADRLYQALLDVFLFWIGRGVKIFRVDNPHTKPVAFWSWVIREIQRKYPDVLFLAEAFTRPKMMKALSKAGFSQSYTYFMWRTSKQEITDYLTELSDPDTRNYFRPNFFTTTPDVLPSFFQSGGRPAFKIRLALAATLSPSYGIVSGYELCENKAMPGTEEYADSEKYEIRTRNWDQAGNIKDFVSTMNAIRKSNAAFHLLENVRFIPTDNDHVIAYAKVTPDKSNALVTVVNLDPHQVQQATLHVPMDTIGLSWGAHFGVEELIGGTRHEWSEHNFVRLDPQTEPVQIFRVKK